MYHCQIIRSTDDLEKIIAEWKEFLDHADGKQFYQDPEKLLLQYRGGAGDSLRILVVRKDGRIRAVAPFVLQAQEQYLKLGIIRLFPLNVRLLALFGSAVLIHRDAGAEDILPFVFERVRALVSDERIDGVYLHDIPCDKDLYGYLQSAPFRRQGFRAVNCDVQTDKNWVVPVTGDFERYLSSLGSNNRGKVKKYLRKMDGRSRFVRVDRPEQVKDFLEAANAIFRKSWQGRTPGYSRQYGDRAFLEGAAEKGWLRSYLLLYDDKPAAFGLCFNYGRRLYCEECGYDLELADLKPGYVLLYRMLEDLFRSGATDLVDLGYGDNYYKRVFARGYYPAVPLYLARPATFFRCVLLCQVALRHVYLTLHRASGALKIEARARAVIKRKTPVLRVFAAQQ